MAEGLYFWIIVRYWTHKKAPALNRGNHKEEGTTWVMVRFGRILLVQGFWLESRLVSTNPATEMIRPLVTV